MVYCALIMAGGKGTRFWPKSTEEKPKQFLNLIGNKTMIQQTFERVTSTIEKDKIFIVTAKQYRNLVEEQLPDLPKKNIIIEPEGKNTAPCILLASLYIKQIYEDANIAVLPSDHIISDNKKFNTALQLANEYVKRNQKAVVTIGIKPNRPETGYGYIKWKEITNQESTILPVERFVEKPPLEKAKEYLHEGNYLWNAGMFIFQVDNMLELLKKNFMQSYEILVNLPKITDNNYEYELENKYTKCEAISIDYAVMEKIDSIYVIPADIGWDDMGTWKSLQRYIKPDNDANFIKGDVKAYNSQNNIIYAENKKIMLIDVDDIFLIETEEMIIVGKKEQLGNVHKYRKEGKEMK